MLVRAVRHEAPVLIGRVPLIDGGTLRPVLLREDGQLGPYSIAYPHHIGRSGREASYKKPRLLHAIIPAIHHVDLLVVDNQLTLREFGLECLVPGNDLGGGHGGCGGRRNG